MIKIWERRLFRRIIEAIRAKHVDVERVFKLLDVNNNSMVSP